MDADTDALLQRLKDGDDKALAEFFSRHRQRLWRMVQFRLHPRLSGRVDAEDVLQEAYLNAAQRIGHYGDGPSPFLWLRMIVQQTLIDVHRRHLGAEMRDAGREVSIDKPFSPQGTSVSLAARLLGPGTSPSQTVVRAETAAQVEEAIASMDPVDREVLALRHFEELTNAEVAEVLGIGATAASNRYVRALARLKEILARIPGFFDA